MFILLIQFHIWFLQITYEKVLSFLLQWKTDQMSSAFNIKFKIQVFLALAQTMSFQRHLSNFIDVLCISKHDKLSSHGFAKPIYSKVICMKHMEMILIVFFKKHNQQHLEYIKRAIFRKLFFIHITSLQCSKVNHKMIFCFNNQEFGVFHI